MIYDCFLFFNEFDLLDIRLHELADVVDRFVLLESTRTFTFKEKPLYAQNLLPTDPRFAKLWNSSRLEYIPLEDNRFDGVDTSNPWAVEARHRNWLMHNLSCYQHDIVMLSDADEIPSARFVRQAWGRLSKGDTNDVLVPSESLSWYYLNCVLGDKWTAGTRAATWRTIASRGLTGEGLRKSSPAVFVDDASGWHFSFMGDIQQKLAAFAHAEYNTPPFNTPEHIARCKAAHVDLFGRKVHQPMQVTQDLSFLPKYVQDNPEKFRHLFA